MLNQFPSVARIITGTNLIKNLTQMKIEIPLLLNPNTGEIPDVNVIKKQTKTFSVQPTNYQSVTYELPITWEEYVSIFTLEVENLRSLDLFQSQVATMIGVCQIFTSKLVNAEENLRKSLKLIEFLGLEAELNACDLYNSIAQMMIMKYRHQQTENKNVARREANQFINTDEGKKCLKEEVFSLRAHYRSRNLSISPAKIDKRSKLLVIRARAAQIMGIENDSTKKSVEAAYRYLVRSFEILETTHGAYHPSVGAACLAVASVQNIIENYENSREWLVRALKCMEKINPLPERAISFIQVQLSQIFKKQGRHNESKLVLTNAATFHLEKAKNCLKDITSNQQTIGSQVVSQVTISSLIQGTQCYDDVKIALDLNSQLVKICTLNGDKEQSIDQAEISAVLAESVFGWDSAEVSMYRKEVLII
jgi:hypothetical protein